jgi:hypothetical protein
MFSRWSMTIDSGVVENPARSSTCPGDPGLLAPE